MSYRERQRLAEIQAAIWQPGRHTTRAARSSVAACPALGRAADACMQAVIKWPGPLAVAGRLQSPEPVLPGW
jgi:hypothetical protein